MAWSFCSPLLCSTAGDPLGGRLSGRPSVRLSVWDAVWGRARVVLGFVSRVRVAEALLRRRRRRRPPLVVCCSCYSGVDIAWPGGCDRGW